MKTLFVDRFNKSVIIFCAILIKKNKSVFFRYFVPKTGMSNPGPNRRDYRIINYSY